FPRCRNGTDEGPSRCASDGTNRRQGLSRAGPPGIPEITFLYRHKYLKIHCFPMHRKLSAAPATVRTMGGDASIYTPGFHFAWRARHVDSGFGSGAVPRHAFVADAGRRVARPRRAFDGRAHLEGPVRPRFGRRPGAGGMGLRPGAPAPGAAVCSAAMAASPECAV